MAKKRIEEHTTTYRLDDGWGWASLWFMLTVMGIICFGLWMDGRQHKQARQLDEGVQSNDR